MRGHIQEILIMEIVITLMVLVLIVIPSANTNKVINYQEYIIQKADEYSQQHNIDLDGETVFDVHNLLIKDNIVKNDKSEDFVSELCYTKTNNPRKFIKNKETEEYDIVPPIE